jgi:uncharacterized protein YcaQ
MPDLSDMSLMDARAAADELDRMRSEAVARGVEYVSVYALAQRVEELRAHERKKAQEAEEMLLRVAGVDARRNHGIGQEQ